MIKILQGINTTQVTMIEDCILNIQMRDNVDGNLDKIKQILNNSINSKCKCNAISIFNSNSNNLYGMRVYPNEASLETLSFKVVDPKITTKELTKFINEKMTIDYVIEIDSNLLYNKIYNFKPGEIAAILLHEIGHVVADSDFYNDLKSYYNEALMALENTDLSEKKLSRDDAMVGCLFVLSSIEKTRVQYNSSNSIELEQIADKFAVQCGYGDELVSAMKKFDKIYMSQYKKSNKDQSLKTEAEAFANLNKVFKIRTKYVTSILDAESKATNSNLVKKVISSVKAYIKHIKFSESVSVSVPLMDREFINEGFISKWLTNPLKISQLDIDDLKIESEMMEDYDDKSILVFKIHKRINQLNKTLASDKINDNVSVIAKNYINQLNELLKNVMKFNATPKRYGVFIKYPKGYEG